MNEGHRNGEVSDGKGGQGTKGHKNGVGEGETAKAKDTGNGAGGGGRKRKKASLKLILTNILRAQG